MHEWSGREVGYTPLSLIAQVAESSRHGYIVPSPTPPPGTPPAYLATPPKTRAQITFIAGDHNNMFRWQGQHRAARFFDESVGRGQADFVALPGFGHLDTFWARDAPEVSFPVIKAGLEWKPGDPPPHQTTARPMVGGPLPPRRGRIFNRRSGASIGAERAQHVGPHRRREAAFAGRSPGVPQPLEGRGDLVPAGVEHRPALGVDAHRPRAEGRDVGQADA